MTFEQISEQLNYEYNAIEEILPPIFRKNFREKTYIAGGSIYSLRHDKEPKDIDFFCRDKKYAEQIRNYFCLVSKRPPSYKGKFFGKYLDKQVIITDNAVSFGSFQFITKYIGSPKEVISSFDFKHNCFGFVNGNIEKYASEQFLDSDDLAFNNNRARDIAGAISRISKFTERGMKISKKEICTMLSLLHEKGFSKEDLDLLESFKDGKGGDDY